MFTIIYTCPQCGSDLEEYIITTNPSINRKVCKNCGWTSDEEKPLKVIRTPFIVPSIDKYTHTTSVSPCDNCSNNPKNGGSGICHCILGKPIIT